MTYSIRPAVSTLALVAASLPVFLVGGAAAQGARTRTDSIETVVVIYAENRRRGTA
jgi:phospholipase C